MVRASMSVDAGIDTIEIDTSDADSIQDTASQLADRYPAPNVALLGQLVGEPGFRSNFLWHLFMNPGYAALYGQNDREHLGRNYAAELRITAARRLDDPSVGALVDELRTHSAEFARMWDPHEVATMSKTRKLLQHPLVGLLDCECNVVITPPSQQRLVLFRGTPGTDTGERLGMLQVHGTQELQSEHG